MAADHLIEPVPEPAVRRTAVVQVRVVPNRAYWTYHLGENASFTIHVIADQHPLEGATVTYSVGQSMMPATEQTAAVPPEGLIVQGGTMNEPGFLRCIAKTTVNGRNYRHIKSVRILSRQV